MTDKKNIISFDAEIEALIKSIYKIIDDLETQMPDVSIINNFNNKTLIPNLMFTYELILRSEFDHNKVIEKMIKIISVSILVIKALEKLENEKNKDKND